MGDTTPDERQTAYQQLAGLIGLPQYPLRDMDGSALKSSLGTAARSTEIVGLYDASITDRSLPDRLVYEGIDPTLEGLDRLFTGAINSHLRDTLGVETEFYHL